MASKDLQILISRAENGYVVNVVRASTNDIYIADGYSGVLSVVKTALGGDDETVKIPDPNRDSSARRYYFGPGDEPKESPKRL